MSGKLVVFDFDGPIVDSLHACWNVSKSGNANITLDEYREMFNGNIHETLKVTTKLSYPQGFDFWAAYRKGILPREPVAGIRDVLATLKNEGIPIVIVSSSLSTEIQNYLDTYQLSGFFDEILGADLHPSKVEKFKMLPSKYNVSYKDMIFITDTLGDLLEAQKLAIKSIAITWGYHDEINLLRGNPTTIVKETDTLAQTALTLLKS